MRVVHEKIYGLSAARAVMEVRPEDVLRIAHTEKVRKELAPMLREAARRRIAYEERSEEDVARIADSTHHEGICLSAKPRTWMNTAELREAMNGGGFVAALDHVTNPHNIGAILRSAAYFGVNAVLLEGEGSPRLSSAAVRIAEGGAERLRLAWTHDLAGTLTSLRHDGAAVFGMDAGARRSIHAARWTDRTVIALGNEHEGLTPEVRRICTEMLAIPGAGGMESLNVSVAAGVVFAAATKDRVGS